ncbi:MAG: ROK family protein [Gammaproteobacteria bacterium]
MRIGIDLGGTKTEILVIDQHGAEIYRKRIPTERDSYDALLTRLIDLIRETEAHVKAPCTIGIGIPGTVDTKRQVVKNANLTMLNGHPLANDISTALQRPVRISNDANCFALSEASDGAGAGAAVVFGVIVGTGCGAGIIVNGSPLEGLNGLAGEWGHNRLNDTRADETPGPDCYCGQKGCVETWISGTGFEKAYERLSGQRLSGPEILSLSEQGDAIAEQALQDLENRMARALSQIINILDPDVIVLGGGLSNIDRLYDNVPKLWDQWTFSDVPVATSLKKNMHGDSSGVRGAAWLWPKGGAQ